MRGIKTYIKERIEKTRQTYDSDHPRCLLDHYIQSCSKEDKEDLVSGKPTLLILFILMDFPLSIGAISMELSI